MNWKHYDNGCRINKDDVDGKNIVPSIGVFLENQNENKNSGNVKHPCQTYILCIYIFHCWKFKLPN